MCGIYGIHNHKNHGFSLDDIKTMGDVLSNRGPDDRGDYIDDCVMLGHNRLSIIDLSSSGHQPMSNEDKTVWVTFNGEIYNFKDLKNNLNHKHVFKSKTDTEVIIHAYEEMGEDLWGKLEGMFAFGLWDSKKQVFYLVRDHYGIKPLFYSELNKSLIFSSQIKGILSLNNFNLSYNYQALSNYFSYFYVPGPETIAKDIMQLQPGCFLKKIEDKSTITRFHRLNFNINYNRDEDHLIDEIQEKVKESVQKSIISDVPVGLLLSGGMDSNLLLSEMSETYPERITTCTLSVDEKTYDEGKFAEEISRQFGSIHFDEQLNYNNFDDLIEDIVFAADSLNANPGLIMKYQFFKMASQHVKVGIIGTGGDELYAGYPTYKANMYHKYFNIIPGYIKSLLLKGVNAIPVSYSKYSYDYVLRKFLEGSLFEREKAHYWWRTIFTDDEKLKLLNPEIIKEENVRVDASYKYIERFNETDGDFENRALYSDFYLFLSDNDLILSDHLSMHFSLEVRPPFLHQEFVKYSLTIPYQYKFRPNCSKYILRKAYKNRLPQNVLKRKKHGVVAPLGLLFKNELKQYVQEQLSVGRLRPLALLNEVYVQEILKNHFDGKQDNGFKIWTLLCFVKWNEIFYKNYN